MATTLNLNPSYSSLFPPPHPRHPIQFQTLRTKFPFPLHATKTPLHPTPTSIPTELHFLLQTLALTPDQPPFPKLHRFLTSSDPTTRSAFPTRIRLLLNHIPPDHLPKILADVDLAKVFRHKPEHSLHQSLSYLHQCGGISWLFRRPQLLNLDFDSQLLPRIEFFIEINSGDVERAAALIGKLPYVLAYSVRHNRSHVEFWRSVGIREDEFARVAGIYPNVFSVSRERKLGPRVEFLRECGLGSGEIYRFLLKAPLFLSLSFRRNLAMKLCLLVKIGYRHRTREMAAAVGAVTRTSTDNMQMVISVLLELGFCVEDVMVMTLKQPQILQYNYKDLKRKVDYLVGEMDRDIGELLSFPAFLGYKLDDRIKKRYESKKNRGKEMSINKLLSVSAESFFWEDGCLDEVKN